MAGPQISKEWPILLVHNHYRTPGGEEQVFHSEAALLEKNGHRVIRFEEHNDRIDSIHPIALGLGTIWNRDACRRLDAVMRRDKPRIVHFHNTFPLISPAAYRIARRQGAAVVQTLHNFRFLCVNGLFFREGKPCEKCLDECSPWPGVRNRCYRDSFVASATVAAMISFHRRRQTWTDDVDAYITPGEMSRAKFVAGGFPSGGISIKTNFIDSDPGIGTGLGGYLLFAGRLNVEKGFRTLIAAWKRLKSPVPLHILGEGPLGDWARQECASFPHVSFLGLTARDRVLAEMKSAIALIFPSECYEAAAVPNVVLEALATGLPVIASDSSAAAAEVDRAQAGVQFRAGDPADLALQVELFLRSTGHSGLRKNARARFEQHATAESNYLALTAIYHAATIRRGNVSR